MKMILLITSFVSILACGSTSSVNVEHTCFVVASFPDFKVGGSIDTEKIQEYVLPVSTDAESSEIKRGSTAFKCLGFDQGINDMMVYTDKETKKITWIDAGWNYFEAPDIVLEKISSTYLPCMPVDQLKANPGELITFTNGNLVETYKYEVLPNKMVSIHYSAYNKN